MEHLLRNKPLRHLLVWILIGFSVFIPDPVLGTLEAKIIGVFLIMTNYMTTYYTMNLFIFPKFLRKNYFLLIINLILIYAFFETLIVFTINFVLPKLGGENDQFPIQVFLVNTFLLFFFLFISSLGNHLNKIGTDKIKEQNNREKALITKEIDVLKKEKAVISKELDFLKNQFNAHITFNFLNFCYRHTLEASEKAAEAIETFSDMLRYSLEIKPDENVFLTKEIEYIMNFIEIQKCLTSNVYVIFNYEGCISDKMLLPRILITFVENAFKHGEINNKFHPIHINLIANPERISFKISNKKNFQNKIISTYTGGQNVKQLLESFYKDKYYLTIKETLSEYSCELRLAV